MPSCWSVFSAAAGIDSHLINLKFMLDVCADGRGGCGRHELVSQQSNNHQICRLMAIPFSPYYTIHSSSMYFTVLEEPLKREIWESENASSCGFYDKCISHSENLACRWEFIARFMAIKRCRRRSSLSREKMTIKWCQNQMRHLSFATVTRRHSRKKICL